MKRNAKYRVKKISSANYKIRNPDPLSASRIKDKKKIRQKLYIIKSVLMGEET